MIGEHAQQTLGSREAQYARQDIRERRRSGHGPP